MGDGFSIKMSRRTVSKLPSILRRRPGLGASAKSVQTSLLPLVKPTADGIAVCLTDDRQLIEGKAFAGKQDGLSALSLAMAFAVVVQLCQCCLVSFSERRNMFHTGSLPESKIPDYLCTIT